MTAGVGRDGVCFVTMHGPIAVRVRRADSGWHYVESRHGRSAWTTEGVCLPCVTDERTYELARQGADAVMARLKGG